MIKSKDVEENMVNAERYKIKLRERENERSKWANYNFVRWNDGWRKWIWLNWTNKQEGKSNQFGNIIAEVEN